ncbi:MAG: DUF3592 domain-containing protein [Akkermansiaceae bacterium]|nr:DUF3592 domain-containing protein [Akkermansiaceae bacterium]MCF7730597.1 DUF3592 domain-containing protein [Akkermansiaceae bacterium]
MRNIISRSILASVYAVFFVAVGLYAHRSFKYRGVDTWPSVDAKIVGGGGGMFTIPTSGRFGTGSTTLDSSFVEFEYFIDGQRYISKTSSPNGGGLPPQGLNESWKAFYDPSSPDIAVLSPTPYWGAGLLVIAGFSGIIVLTHLWTTLPELLTKQKQTEQVGDGDAEEAV